MTLDVQVQRARCIATKSCMSAAPHTFALDPTRIATVTGGAGGAPDEVITAAEACPTGAISVYRDGVKIA